MTITVQNASTIALGDGINTTFDFSFVGAIAADIEVFYTDTAGTVTLLDPSVYTLVMNAAGSGQLWGIGGTVTYPLVGSPIALGTTLTMTRALPYVQATNITNQGAFYPAAVEQAMDILCMEIQQLYGLIQGTSGTGSGTIVGPATSSNYGVAYFIGTNGLRLGSTLAGTAGYVLTGNGPGSPPDFQLPPGQANGIITTVSYSPGTYTISIPAGATLASISLIGGGGGGEGAAGNPGAGNVSVGSGGSGAAWLQSLVTASTIDGQTLVVGDRGAGGAAGSNNGANGQDTTLLALVAGGGLGGTLGTTQSTPPYSAHSMAGGTATGGDTSRPGGPSGTDLTTSTSAAFGGHGGDSQFSPGTAPAVCGTNSQANGANATGFGGGGGGAVASGTGTSTSGGNGSSGAAWITYYGFSSATSSAIGEATQAQQEAGVLGTVYVSPRNQQWHGSAVKAHAYVSASGTILMGYNIASVSHDGTGLYTVNFTNAMTSTSYAVVSQRDTQSGHNGSANVVDGSRTSSSFQLQVFRTSATGNSLEDAPFSFQVTGQAGAGGGGTGAIVFLTASTASGTPASIDFASVFSDNAAYGNFEVWVTNAIPATDNVNFDVRVSTDGSTFVTASSYYASVLFNRSGASTPSGAGLTGGTAWNIPGSWSNTSRDNLNAKITFMNPTSSLNKLALYECAMWSDNFASASVHLASLGYSSSLAVTGFQVLASSGNLGDGTRIAVFGVVS